MIIGFIPAFLYLYFYLPFIAVLLAVYHGIQGFCKDKLESVEEIQFLNLFVRFCVALPQFILGLTYYVSNTHFVNTNDNLFDSMLPTTLISIVFSGVSVALGLISGLVAIIAGIIGIYKERTKPHWAESMVYFANQKT